MSVLQAIFLGIIQGISEFLPVSSTGQLTFFGNFIGLEQKPDLMFLILLHIASFFGIFFAYKKTLLRNCSALGGIAADVVYNAKERFSNSAYEKNYRKIVNGSPSRRMAVMICISLIPSCVIGVLIVMLSEMLCWNLLCSGIGLFITALLLLVGSFAVDNRKNVKEAKYLDAVMVGAFNGFSCFHGISGLAVCYSSGLLSGFSSKFAKQYYFSLAVPTIIAAYIFEALRVGSIGSQTISALPTFAAFLAAAATGFAVARVLLSYVTKKNIRYFAIYAALIGIVSVVLYLF